MKRVYTSMDPLLTEQVRTALEHVGIRCRVDRRDLRPLVGSVPFVECWPEVWVLDDARAEEAEDLIAAIAKSSTTPAWNCERCGERLDGRFTSCWRCEGAAEIAATRSAKQHARRIRNRVRALYPQIVLWVVLALMAFGALAVLKAQYGSWP